MRLKKGFEPGINRTFGAFSTIFLGLIISQILATIQVYLSNLNLHETIIAVTAAGYLSVPNQHIAIHLKEFGTAFWGGLFFTLSLGSGLSILSFACAFLWDQLFSRNKILLILLLLFWLVFLFALNWQGFNFLVTSYFLFIPPAVFGLNLRRRPRQSGQKSRLMRIIYLLPIVGLALLLMWASKSDSNIFINTRDNLLLSNPVGRTINNAYYRYTLYPAEVFKPLDQKILRTANLESIDDDSHRKRMEIRLLRFDYLPLKNGFPADLTITMKGDLLVFENKGKTITEASSQEFLNRPGQVLNRFSAKSDPYGLFRQATIWSLLLGLPIMMYIFAFSILRFFAGFYMDFAASSIVAATLCFLLGLALLIPIIQSKGAAREIDDMSQALKSKQWQKRVAALRTIKNKRMEIGDFPAYRRLLSSPRITERYWLAQALGVSRRDETYKDLLALWDDPNRNVVCMVYAGLGFRSKRGVEKQIIERLKESEDWYVQGYAYRALRRLGWKQKRSN
ncbi:MAG: HEAT repeat domain-containing protein [Deltaproteobacteria bacterium]|nr:HEAT repeat domain-containing protein [Deltaproteobacteria bacterium]